MDIQFYGANCVSLSSKNVRIVIDDNLADLGGKSIVKNGDIVLYTGAHGKPASEPKIVIDKPGEYEVSEVFIYGIPARAHIDTAGQNAAVMYRIVLDELKLLVAGHIYPELSDQQLETIGMIDVMFVPVGGNGYTLDPIGALKLIKKIEPKLVIPTHFDDPALHYPVPQQPLDQAVKGLAMEPKETTGKLRLKAGELGDVTQLVILK